MIKIYDKYKNPRKPYEGEKLQKGTMTDVAGYKPVNIRIEEMIRAGQRLVQSNKESYDIQHGEEHDDIVVPSHRKRGTDILDHIDEARRVAKNVKNMVDEVESKKKQASKQAVEPLSEKGGTSDIPPQASTPASK